MLLRYKNDVASKVDFWGPRASDGDVTAGPRSLGIKVLSLLLKLEDMYIAEAASLVHEVACFPPFHIKSAIDLFHPAKALFIQYIQMPLFQTVFFWMLIARRLSRERALHGADHVIGDGPDEGRRRSAMADEGYKDLTVAQVLSKSRSSNPKSPCQRCGRPFNDVLCQVPTSVEYRYIHKFLGTH